MNPLVINKYVWSILAVITLAITVVFAVLIYFSDIFIVLIVGTALIILAERLIFDFKRSASKYKFSQEYKKLYGAILIMFWLFAFGFIFANSVGDLTDVFKNPEVSRSVISEYILKLNRHIPPIFGYNLINQTTISTVGNFVFGIFSSTASKVSFLFFNGILIIPLMFALYFKRGAQIKSAVIGIIPDLYRPGFARAYNQISKQLHDYISIKVTQSIVIGFISALGFFIGGVKGWLVLGILAGFLNIVPYLGPPLGGVFPVIVSLIAADARAAIIAVITVVIAQIVDNFYLSPFVVPGKVQIDPLLSIILILVGAKMLGVLGMVLAIPIFLVYKITLRESYRELVKIYN